MVIKPTKTWLKDHPPMKLCPWKDTGCHCVFTSIDIDKYSTGFCVGLASEVDDLDIVRICSNLPIGDNTSENTFCVVAQVTPVEAVWLSTYIQIAVANIFQLDPDYRKAMGKMRHRKARIVKK